MQVPSTFTSSRLFSLPLLHFICDRLEYVAFLGEVSRTIFETYHLIGRSDSLKHLVVGLPADGKAHAVTHFMLRQLPRSLDTLDVARMTLTARFLRGLRDHFERGAASVSSLRRLRLPDVSDTSLLSGEDGPGLTAEWRRLAAVAEGRGVAVEGV